MWIKANSLLKGNLLNVAKCLYPRFNKNVAYRLFVLFRSARIAGKHVMWQKQFKSTVIQIPVAFKLSVCCLVGLLGSFCSLPGSLNISITAQQSLSTFLTLKK